MQDILDGGWDSLNLNSNGPSRANSAKKIQKKENGPSPKADSKRNMTSRDEFDDLLNSVINKQSRYNAFDNSSANTTKRLNNDSLDSRRDQIKSPKNNHLTIAGSTGTSAFARTSFGQEVSYRDIVEEHGVSHQFGSTQKSIVNPSRGTESFVSTRNMKPPLRPREPPSGYSHSINFNQSAIPQQDHTLPNSSNNNSSALRRRSSIDARSQLSDDVLPLGGNRPLRGGTMQSANFDTIKEDAFPDIHKSESCFIEQKNENDPGNFFKAKGKLQNKSEEIKQGESDKKRQLELERKQKQIKQIISDYDRQIEMLKKSYQSQLNHLQECLDKQIQQNRHLREQFIEESHRLLEEERKRSAKLHAQELQRTKEMLSWQQKKHEQAYKLQIESIKASLQYANGQHDWLKNTQIPTQQYLQTLQTQLSNKEQTLEHKLKKLEQRQLELQSRESQLSMRMSREEDRIRQQEKRITQMEYDFKTRMMQQKKALARQKQTMAAQMASIQSDIMRQKHTFALSQRQLQLQLESIQDEKMSLQKMNTESMFKQRQVAEQLQRQKQRLKVLQVQLIRKLRIVQTKAKELTIMNVNNHEDMQPFVRSVKSKLVLDNSFTRADRAQSVQKKLYSTNSMSNMAKTKQRFELLQRNSKSRMNRTTKENKKIDLSNYISRVESSHKNKHA